MNENYKKEDYQVYPAEKMKDNINEYVKRFLEEPEDAYKERILKIVFNDNIFNEKIEELLNSSKIKEEVDKEVNIAKILIKSTLLNSFYSAGVMNKHLYCLAFLMDREKVNQKLDQIAQKYSSFKACKGNYSELENIVEYIAQLLKRNPDALPPKSVKEKDPFRIYSFATKYCSWCYPKLFPIVDSYSKKELYKYNKEIGFHKKSCKKTMDSFINYCNKYSNYCEIYNAFIEKYDLLDDDAFSVKKIDMFLWKHGKEMEKREREETNSITA